MVQTAHIQSHGRTAEILIDGVPLAGAASYYIEHYGGELPTLNIQIRAKEIVIDGEFDVKTEAE